jgi:putative NADH-flavin reductase
MKIAILGSGQVGGHLLQRAPEAGYQVRVLARHPDKIKQNNECVEIVQGDARDIAAIRSLLQGCDAVLNALGQRHVRGEAPVFSEATGNLLSVMNELGIRRYILLRGFSVDAPGDHKDLRTRIISMLVRSIIHGQWVDWQKELDMLMSSSVDWTLFRLSLVVEKPPVGQVRVDLASPPGKDITGDDLADFLLRQITDPAYSRKAPFIAN